MIIFGKTQVGEYILYNKKPNMSEICDQLSKELGAELIKGNFWKWGDKVLFKMENWTIKLEYNIDDWMGRTFIDYSTKLTAPFVNKDGLRFKITPHVLPVKLSHILGFQDIEIGRLEFDKKFIIKGNEVNKIKELFNDDEIVDLLSEIDSKIFLEIEVKDNEGFWGEKYPGNVDLLHFEHISTEYIRDIELLKSLIKLQSKLLYRLYFIGSISNDNPNIY